MNLYKNVEQGNIMSDFFFLDFVDSDCVYCPNSCGRSYIGHCKKGNLARHLKYECGVFKQFKCSLCYKMFSQKHDFHKHCLFVHNLILNK